MVYMALYLVTNGTRGYSCHDMPDPWSDQSAADNPNGVFITSRFKCVYGSLKAPCRADSGGYSFVNLASPRLRVHSCFKRAALNPRVLPRLFIMNQSRRGGDLLQLPHDGIPLPCKAPIRHFIDANPQFMFSEHITCHSSSPDRPLECPSAQAPSCGPSNSPAKPK